MGVANHVFRRGAVYIWRRRIPNRLVTRGTFQISLRTRDPEVARQIAAVVTAESASIFKDMESKRLTPAEARALFDRVVREESARLANPNTTLSDLREAPARGGLPARYAAEVYALALLRALRGDQADPGEDAFFAGLLAQDGTEARDLAARHLHEEAHAYAAPLLDAADRPFAERVVASAMRRAEGVADEELLAAYRVILTARASAYQPERGLTIKSAAEIRAEDDLDQITPKIPAAWFDDAAAQAEVVAARPAKPAETADTADAADHPDPDIFAVVQRVNEQQRDDGINPAQQQQTRQTAKLFSELTGVTDLRQLRQRHLSAFSDQLRKLPRSYGKSVKDRDRPITDIIADAATLPADKRGLSAGTTNRHLSIIRRIVNRAGSEGIELDRYLDFTILRRKDSRRARDRRDTLTLDEVRQLFRHPVFRGSKTSARRRTPGKLIVRDALYWLPILAAYTGARREELAAMEAGDVSQIDGIWCLALVPNDNRGSLKNLPSVRVVPIHSRIIALGFLDYVQSVPQGGNLFPELKRKSPNAGLGEHVAHLIAKIFEDQYGSTRGNKSFHSFRHYVTDMLRDAVPAIPKHVRVDVLGHAGEDIEDETYGSTTPLAVMQAAIEALPDIFAAER